MATIDQKLATSPHAGTPGEERFVLRDIPWQAYLAISDALEDRAAPRVTFDRGTLEFMTPLAIHEFYRCNLRRLIETMAEECQLEIKPGGSMTFRRDDLDHAFELDDCFWIDNEASVRGRIDYDPHTDPPPDLGVEIEITRSAVNRMTLFAAMKVREIWRFDGQTMGVEILQPDGNYRSSERSSTFPWAEMQDIVPFIVPNDEIGYLAVIRDFRDWVRRTRR